MANGKKKGSKNERDLAKWWKEWSGIEFTRVPASGGLRWKKTDNISGDIICADPRHSRRFPFTVEAKFYKDINFEHLILGNKSIKILEFWQQATEDAERSSKIPILFMRYNGMPKAVWFVIMGLETFNIMLKQKGGKMNNIYFIIEAGERRLACINSKDMLDLDYKEFCIKNKKMLRNGK